MDDGRVVVVEAGRETVSGTSQRNGEVLHRVLAPRRAPSPQGEGPLLVAAQPVAVDGGGAGNCVQVVRAVGQRRDPLAALLGFGLPSAEQHQKKQKSRSEGPRPALRTRTARAGLSHLPDGSRRLRVDGNSLELLVVALEDLLTLGRLQQCDARGCSGRRRRSRLQQVQQPSCFNFSSKGNSTPTGLELFSST